MCNELVEMLYTEMTNHLGKSNESIGTTQKGKERNQKEQKRTAKMQKVY